jgi:FkbM family methyltransferase
MIENFIPRVLGWVPISWRRAVIGRPDNPSRVATLAHDLLNRLSPADSHIFDCKGVLEGYRMSIDWNRFRSFVYGTWESEVIKVIATIVEPGMAVMDIGAHIGYYSLLFAKQVGPAGRVFAFEPLAENFALLQKNVKLNNLKNVQLLSQAVFSRRTRITINVPDEQLHPGSGSLYNARGVRQYDVDAISVDDFCEESGIRPHILKMDVEGAENDVLIGAEKTVARYRPKLLIELHHFDGDVAKNPVPELLTGWRYQIHWIEHWQFTSHILATPVSAESLTN